MGKYAPKLILASQSAARRTMLRDAGLEFESIPADIDETFIIESSLHGGCVQSIAAKLAEQKALTIAAKHPDALVIGSDQMLECDGRIFEKAKTPEAAKDKLKTLSGQTHRLISAVCIACNNETIWQSSDTAALTMHDLSDDFIDHYLEIAKDDALHCVGAYALEKAGIWLFNKIEGDYHTILGMPLLPLLTYLRTEHEIMP
ncbi:MAG: Maf family protein [Bdellovibrionales bacterium]